MLARLAAGQGPSPVRRPVAGVACDAYEPRGAARAAVVALHGVTVQGKDDRRLGRFARALAASGARCVVPTLPGLSALRWERGDVDAIAAVVDAATAEAGCPAVIVGFSHGASLGLLAAARPGTSARVGYVLGFGAYHSLPRFFGRIRALSPPRGGRALSDVAYAWLVEARRRAGTLALSPAFCAAADDLLRRWCDAASDAEKRAFFDAHLRGLDLGARVDPAADATFPALSPEGNLGGLACPVALVHAPDDHLVPVSEAEALLAEVRRAAPGARHRLLVTRLVEHVAAARVPRPAEVLALLSMLAPLVGGAPR
jgi:alpha-beta hydrolase superfamily lysophospholipase